MLLGLSFLCGCVLQWHEGGSSFSEALFYYVFIQCWECFSLSLFTSYTIKLRPSSGWPTLDCDTVGLILIFKRRLFHKDNPQGYEGNQNPENEQRIPAFSPLLSSLATLTRNLVSCFLFFSQLCFSPHISSPLHPCWRCHCKCHVENKEGRFIVCALLFCTQAGISVDS